MGDARVGLERGHAQVQLVMIAERLTFHNEEDGMPVVFLRLQTANLAVVGGGRKQPHGNFRGHRSSESIDVELIALLAQHHALAGAQCFAPFPGAQIAIKFRFRQCFFRTAARWQETGRKIFGGELGEDALTVECRTRVIPGDGFHGRLIQRAIWRDVRAGDVALGEAAVCFNVDLLDPPKAAELALHAVEVAVVITVGAGEAGLSPLIRHGHFLDAMNRKRQLRDPRLSRGFVGEVELGGGRVLNGRLGTEVVARLDEQVRFLSAHQIDVAHLPSAMARQGGRPDEAGRAVAEQIDDVNGTQTIDPREGRLGGGATPTVARLIEVNMHAVAVEVNDISGTRAIDIGETDAFLIELIRVVEPRRVVHRHLGTKTTVAEIWPVADVSVADADEVGEAVATHVGEIDRLCAVGEDELWAGLFVAGLAGDFLRPKTFFRERGMPAEAVVFGDEQIRVAVAGEIHELQFRVVPIEHGQGSERGERLPAFGVRSTLVETGGRSPERDQVGPAIAGEIHELGFACCETGSGLGRDQFDRSETRFQVS